jgi:hypothetical protein
MLVMTTWAPWAQLIAIGAKPWEFRGYDYRDRVGAKPNPGDRIVIHVAARRVRIRDLEKIIASFGSPTNGLIDKIAEPYIVNLLVRLSHGEQPMLGVGIATAVIGLPIRSCDLFELDVRPEERGLYNFAWPLTKIRPLDAPVPLRGVQGFWRWREAA